MATKTFVFPDLVVASGTYRFEIHYTAASTSSTDVDDLVWEISPVKMQFEIPADSQTFRHSFCKINVFNLNNAFETNSIYDAGKRAETFMDIYKDGSIFWSGRVDWDKSEKKNWFKSGSSFLYREYELYCVDRLEYLKNYDLTDASYSNGITIEDLLDNIAALISLTISFPDEWLITETSGNTYAINTSAGATALLRLKNLTTTTTCLEFVKNICLAMGLFVFTLNEEIIFTMRNRGVSTTSITVDDIIDMRKIQTFNEIDYIKIASTVDINALYPNAEPTDTTIFYDSGTQSADDSRNFIIEGVNEILNGIYTTPPGGGLQYPSPKQVPTSGDTEHIYDSTVDFLGTDYIETGMMVYYNWDGISAFENSNVIKSVADLNTIYFYDVGNAVNASKEYWVLRHSFLGSACHKIELVSAFSLSVYQDYFQNEILSMELFGIHTPDNLIDFDSNDYKPNSADIDIYKHKTQFTLRKLA